jgi:hypothetical protein
MAATVVINNYHGTTGATVTQIDGTTIKYKVADNSTNDANNPIPIPGAGTGSSFIKHMKFNCTVAPANLINNLKVYSDGANGLGTGCDLMIRTNATYTDPVANGATLLAGTASVFTYTSGAALAVTGTQASTGSFGDYVVSQFNVASTATQGNSGTEVITFQFDES